VVKGLQRVRSGMPVDAQDIPMANKETLAALAEQLKAVEASNPPRVAQKSAQNAAPRG